MQLTVKQEQWTGHSTLLLAHSAVRAARVGLSGSLLSVSIYLAFEA
jgi:hypothetical protein